MAIYMEHPSIKGNVTAEGFTDQVAIDSMQWGVGRAISTPVGKAADREASTPSVSEVTLSKVTDKSSTALIKAAVTSPKGEDVILRVVSTSSDKVDTIVEIKLINSVISSYSLSSGGDRPSESFSINFTKIEYAYTAEDAANTGAGPARTGYDLATGKPV